MRFFLTALIFTLISTSPATAEITVEELRLMCASEYFNPRISCEKFIQVFAQIREAQAQLDLLLAGKYTEGRAACQPMSTSSARSLFLQWSDLHREQWQENAEAGTRLAWNSEFPCTQP